MASSLEQVRSFLDEDVKNHREKVRKLDLLLVVLSLIAIGLALIAVVLFPYLVFARELEAACVTGAFEFLGVAVYKIVGPSVDAHRNLLVAHRAAIFELLSILEGGGNERELQVRLISAQYLARDADPAEMAFLRRQFVALQLAHGNPRFGDMQYAIAMGIAQPIAPEPPRQLPEVRAPRADKILVPPPPLLAAGMPTSEMPIADISTPTERRNGDTVEPS